MVYRHGDVCNVLSWEQPGNRMLFRIQVEKRKRAKFWTLYSVLKHIIFAYQRTVRSYPFIAHDITCLRLTCKCWMTWSDLPVVWLQSCIEQRRLHRWLILVNSAAAVERLALLTSPGNRCQWLSGTLGRVQLDTLFHGRNLTWMRTSGTA